MGLVLCIITRVGFGHCLVRLHLCHRDGAGILDTEADRIACFNGYCDGVLPSHLHLDECIRSFFHRLPLFEGDRLCRAGREHFGFRVESS